MADRVQHQWLVPAASAGAVAMAVSSWWVGAVSVTWHPRTYASVNWIPGEGDPAHLVFYTGLIAFILSWLVLGRRLLARRLTNGRPSITPRLLQRFILCSAVPLLFAAPFGRDLWAYGAQGHLTGLGLDPYTHGPIAAPGVFADEVSARWMASPAPYGPLWLRISQLAAWVSHGHPVVAVLLLRLPAFGALLLAIWAMRVLAQRLTGSRAPARLTTALWLGLASPLMIVLGVGGGHNDLPMIALALAGLAVATRPGLSALAAGAALAALGVMIKSPAAVAFAFAVPVWLHANPEPRTPRRIITACAAALAGAAATVAVITAATGLGLGWTKQVNSDAQWVSWLSLPSAAAMLGKALTGSASVRELDGTVRDCRTVGEVLAILILIALWFVALRRPPLGYLAAALGAAALLAPSVQPWYYAWGLTVAGLVYLRRWLIVVLATVTVMFTLMIQPSGHGFESSPIALWFILGSLAVTALILGRRRSATDDDRPDDPRPQVRADHSTQFGHV